ncbi:MAG: hypothetical protein K8S25_00430, partial [Alphaproteobacteria bacterium]|nr:hypothetical protein [Alphaproteobacteria bacterium]
FAMRNDAMALSQVQEFGFPIDVMPPNVQEIDWLLQLADTYKPIATVLDVRTDLSATSVMRLRGADMIVATIDDASPRRLSADAAFYPPVPQVYALDWRGAESEPFVGWEWVVLGQDISQPLSSKAKRPRIIVSMGGSDPQGLTLPAVRALLDVGVDFDATIVVGPGADHALDREVAKLAPQFTVLRSPGDLPLLMAQADLGLVSFGVTAYELAALGVPALYLCLTDDHAASASAFEHAGMGVSLGVVPAIGEATICSAVEQLLGDRDRRRAMRAAGRMNLDGRGALRIAQRIKRMVDERAAALSVSSVRVLAQAV